MYRIRRIEPADIEILIDFRCQMFCSLAGETFDAAEFRESDRAYFGASLCAGETFAWAAVDDAGCLRACAALSFYRLPPKPWNPEGVWAYVSSMYTEPEHRRKGLGGRLLQTALEFARSRGVGGITLHAAAGAVTLYESFGFNSTNEMRLR